MDSYEPLELACLEVMRAPTTVAELNLILEQIGTLGADPEIQGILQDPVISGLLKQAETNPGCIAKAIKKKLVLLVNQKK